MIIKNINERLKRILEFINPHKKDEILIIGTGTDPILEHILYDNFGCKNITSGDIDENNLIKARKMLPKIRFIYLDAQKSFPMGDNSFDKVILTEVLEHLKNEDFVLREIKRVLKKEGTLILSVPKFRLYKILNPITLFQHEREYNEKTIKNVLEKNNFKITNMFVGGGIFELFSLWIHLILKHIFRIYHREYFFRRKIDRYYEKGYKGKGADIILTAS